MIPTPMLETMIEMAEMEVKAAEATVMLFSAGSDEAVVARVNLFYQRARVAAARVELEKR